MLTANEIGQKIAVARKLKNLSQAQLSEQLTVSAQAIGKWERGESMPDIIMLQHIAAILGTDVNYFVQESAVISETEAALSPALGESKELGEKPGWNMSGGNWTDADFSGLHGLAKRFSGANIEKCQFVESELAGLALKGNNITDSDFSRSNLSECRFSAANLEHDSFAGCDFSRSEFSKSKVSDCDFSGANLTGVTTKWCSFKKLNLGETVLYRTQFAFGQLAEITFGGELIECSFDNCDFTRVTFDGAVLRECFFKNSKLKRAQFINCRADRLTYAFMKTCKADLSDVTVIEDENK